MQDNTGNKKQVSLQDLQKRLLEEQYNALQKKYNDPEDPYALFVRSMEEHFVGKTPAKPDSETNKNNPPALK